MATTKVEPVKGSVDRAMAYIGQAYKTNNGELVSSYGCTPETAYLEFEMTAQMCNCTFGKNKAWVLYQNFSPEDNITPQQAHQITKELADKMLQGHEYVISTHIDKNHIHSHVIFNSVNFTTKKKYVSNKQSYFEIRDESDRLCKKYGISIVTTSKSKSVNYGEYRAEKAGRSWKAQIKKDIDLSIKKSQSFDEFVQAVEVLGYEVKQGKHLAFRPINKERFVRGETLGIKYSKESICERVNKKDTEIKYKLKKRQKTILQIFMQNRTRSVNLEKKVSYLAYRTGRVQQLANSISFLEKNNIISWEDFGQRVDAAHQQRETAEKILGEANIKVKQLEYVKMQLNIYQQVQPIFERTVKTPMNKQPEYIQIKLDAFHKAKGFLEQNKISPQMQVASIDELVNQAKEKVIELENQVASMKILIKEYDDHLGKIKMSQTLKQKNGQNPKR